MLRKRELDPYLQVVKRIRQRNPGTNWDAVYARWGAVVGVAKDYLDQVRSGQPHFGCRRQAAELVVQIADNVEESEAVDLLMAMYLIAEFDPHRFKSDEAFRACLLHVIRREAKAGRKFNYKAGSREKSSYKILGAKVREAAARWIIEALGPVGLHVAKQERRRVDAVADTKAAYRDALDSIK